MSALPTIDLTASVLYTALGKWLQSILGVDEQIRQGQQNRVSMPNGNYVIMTFIGPLLGLHKGARSVSWVAGASNPGQEIMVRSAEAVVQLDFYGPLAHDQASLVELLVSTQSNFDYFQKQYENGGPDMQPLFADGVKNLSLINGEGQFESRWSFDLHFQYNPNITVALDFMLAVDVKALSVESQFPLE